MDNATPEKMASITFFKHWRIRVEQTLRGRRSEMPGTENPRVPGD